MIITIIRDFLDFSFRVVYIYDCVRFWTQCAVLAQSVARRLGKAEVGGSSPLDSFELNPRKCLKMRCFRGFFLLKITKEIYLHITKKKQEQENSKIKEIQLLAK